MVVAALTMMTGCVEVDFSSPEDEADARRRAAFIKDNRAVIDLRDLSSPPTRTELGFKPNSSAGIFEPGVRQPDIETVVLLPGERQVTLLAFGISSMARAGWTEPIEADRTAAPTYTVVNTTYDSPQAAAQALQDQASDLGLDREKVQRAVDRVTSGGTLPSQVLQGLEQRWLRVSVDIRAGAAEGTVNVNYAFYYNADEPDPFPSDPDGRT